MHMRSGSRWIALAFVACGGGPNKPPVVTPSAPPAVTPSAPPVVTPSAPLVTPSARPAVTPSAPPVVTPSAPPADVVTLRALQNGDRACHVVFETGSGETKTHEGAFELCEGAENDASALVGQRVRFTTKRHNTFAMECRGVPDCIRTRVVDLIITIVPAG